MKALGLVALLALLCVCLGSRGVTAQTASEDALAQSLNDALSKGDGAQGLKLAGQLVEEREKRAGTDSVQLIPALRWRAYFRARAGDVVGATGDISRSYSLGERFLGANEHVLTDAALALLVSYFSTDRDLAFSLLAEHPDDQKIAQVALGISRSQKGRIMEATGAHMARMRLQAKGPYKAKETRVLLDDIAAIQSAYQKLAFSAASPFDPATVEQLGALERKIADDQQAMVGAMGLVTLLPDIGQQTRYTPELLAQAGRPGMGNWTVDYVEFQRYRFDKPEPAPPQSEYVGLLTRSDGRIAVALLGPASEIDPFAVRLLGSLSNPSSTYMPLARAGYDRLVAPLIARSAAMGSEVDGVTFVNRFLSVFPDGNLNLVSFAALHDGTSFLIDRFTLSYVSSGLELGLFAPMALNPSFTVEVFANPDFTASVPPGGAQGSKFDLLRGAGGLTPLSATAAEAKAIRTLAPSAVAHEGAEATRAGLLETPAPGILHIATHGIFFDRGPARRGASAVGATLPAAPQELWLQPLVESGLVLAGDGQAPMGGIVTALDVLRLDLSATQLVVLSACETARGAIRPGDSVYGLRYAFRAAGAETVIASLWSIEDESAKSLMGRFYDNLFRGMGRLEAMTQAMRFQKARTEHPANWAAFTVTGSSGRLRGSRDGAIPVIEPPSGGRVIRPNRQAGPVPPPEPPGALYPAGKPQPAAVQDCPQCPPLVAVKTPKGDILMGKFEVTFDEWAVCEADKACTWHPTTPFFGRGRRPVINVSARDTEQYLGWLSKKAGKEYRLPTAAEWEFAARGGGTAPVQAGARTATCYGCDQAAHDDEPTPVGTHEPNALGLYDMLGNVWELTSDCRDQACASRTLRGGSYFETFDKATSETMSTTPVSGRSNNTGFRVVRPHVP